MIVDERFSAYINSLNEGNDGVLYEIEKEAIKTDVPIIRTDTQQFIRTVLYEHKPVAILEVGTAIGFSAVFMAVNNPVSCHITTIENYEKRIPIAKDNFKRVSVEDKITLLEGDATDILKELKGPYDMIFMDAAKAQYINFYPEVKRLLKPGGILLSDNVLQDGDIVESRFIVIRRNRTIHKRMREYLYTLTHDEDMVTSILPIGDGVAYSVKKESK